MAVTKGKASTSFNLTPQGRDILKSLSDDFDLSQGKALTMLIHQAKPTPSNLPKVSGVKGGHPSVFFGKTRGTTTCCELKIEDKAELDRQAKIAGLSRGDYVEYLLRKHEADFNALVAKLAG